MTKRQPKRKNRDTWITLDFGKPVSLNQMTFDRETGQVRVFNDGEERFPESARVLLTYPREKGPKNVVAIPTDSRRLIPHPNRPIQDFSLLLAVDTNYRTIRGQLVGVTSVVPARNTTTQITGKTIVAVGQSEAFEIRDPKGSPERIGWMEVLIRFTNGPDYHPSESVALIVDCDLHHHIGINQRTLPVYGEYDLPEGVTLVYASSDTPNDSIPNQLIRIADRNSADLLRQIEFTEDDSGLQTIDGRPFAQIRTWEPATL
jgi:hypothetical protein